MKIKLDEAFKKKTKKKTKKEQEEFKIMSDEEFKKYKSDFWRLIGDAKPKKEKINVTNSIPPKNK